MAALHRFLLSVRPAPLGSALKRVLGVRRRVVDTPAGRFFVDPASNFGYRVQAPGSYEPDLADAVRRILRPGDTFLDVGANEGFFSVIASKAVAPSGRVIAVEPQSRLQGVIARNLQENRSTNVEVIQQVIADRPGVASLSISPDMNTGSSGVFRTSKYRVPSEDVPQTTLGALLAQRQLASVRLLKMDIEGFEYEAVLGASEVFRAGQVEHFALELHPTVLARRGKSEAEIVGFLAECGYRPDPRFKAHVLRRGV
jgi:FkbM family methyltransferase